MELENPIEEVRRGRDAHAKQFNYDLRRIYEDLLRLQEISGRTYVQLKPQRTQPMQQIALPQHQNNGMSSNGAEHYNQDVAPMSVNMEQAEAEQEPITTH